MNNRTEELAATALRMARARRMRLDAKKVLNVRGHTDEERKQALADLSAARKEGGKASAKLWRMAEKVPR